MDDEPAVNEQPYFIQRLSLEPGADERAIKRAYARELKLIDQETNPAGFQELREAYDTALFWLRNGIAMELDDAAPEPAAPRKQAGWHQPPEPSWGDASGAAAAMPGEHAAPGEETVAREVFDQFQRRCSIAPNMQVSESWQRELYVSLADERLIHISAREAFEQQVADLLASGWRPGHQLLLFAAVQVFEWDQDRRRLRALGAAGYTLDCAIDQRAVYDLQSDQVRELQRQAIARLRDPKPPSGSELIGLMPVLATVEARFPTWLALIADADSIASWHQFAASVPKWRRTLHRISDLRSMRISVSPGWSVVLAVCFILFMTNMLSGGQPSSLLSLAERQVETANQLLDSGDYQGALTAYDRVIRHDPQNYHAYAGRAIAFLDIGDDKNAALDLDTLETLDKRNPELHRGRGMLAYNEQRYPDAIASFTRSLELDSSSIHTQIWRALTYERLGEHDKALADADAVLARYRESVDARLVRARIFKLRGDKSSLLAEAKALLAANTKNAEAYIATARVYNDAGDPKEAMAVVNRGVEEAASAKLYLFRAKMRDATDFEAKRGDLIGALKHDSSSGEAMLMRVRLELAAGQYDAVLAQADIAIHSESTRGFRHYLMAARGVAFTRQGKHAEADAEFALAKASATSAVNLNNLCWETALQNVALKTALSFCDASLALAPDVSATFDSKGNVLLRLKRYKESIAAYNAALNRQADMASSLYGRGIAKRRAGDVKAGDADIRAARALDPDQAGLFARTGLNP